MRRTKEAGFTLVELLIVVTIVGILAAVIIPGLGDKLTQAKYSAAAHDIRVLIDHWQGITPQLLAGGDFARTGERLDVNLAFPQEIEAQELEDLLEIEVPERDPWGNRYEYRVDGFPSRCLLVRSRGGDGLWDSDNYVVGTALPANTRSHDLVAVDRRWIQRWDPVWRGRFPIVPLPPTIRPPRILPPMN